jgi:hypothetical protein
MKRVMNYSLQIIKLLNCSEKHIFKKLRIINIKEFIRTYICKMKDSFEENENLEQNIVRILITLRYMKTSANHC